MAHQHLEPIDHPGAHAHADHLGTYLAVFVTLLVLLILTIGAYYIPFEKIHDGEFGFMNTVIALTIACIKALLVLLFFMHLRDATRLTWVIASAGFVWLIIMISFTFSDYLSRGMVPEATRPLPGMAHTVDMQH